MNQLSTINYQLSYKMNIELGTSYCFDDILMEPLLSSINSRKTIALETNIATNNRKLILKNTLSRLP